MRPQRAYPRPGHADSLHLMGLLSMAAKQYDLAIEWFALAIRQNADVADYFVNLGTALHRKGRFDEAIKSFDRALVLNPGQATIWCMMGELLQQQKRLDEAILSFDQALNVKPDYFEAANSSAMLYFETERYDVAIARLPARWKSIRTRRPPSTCAESRAPA